MFPAVPRGRASAAASAIGTALVAVLAIITLASVAPSVSASTPTPPPPPPPATGGASPSAPAVLVVGDSLAVGMKPYLAKLLAPSIVVWDARSGRTTPEGLQHLRRQLRGVRPQAVVISLGTNDGPDPARFTARISKALRAIPARTCVIWADVYRPARKGRYDALNRALRAQARRHPRLVVVSWLSAVAQRAVHLPDGLHPDAAGFAYRSRLFAKALAQRCGTGR